MTKLNDISIVLIIIAICVVGFNYGGKGMTGMVETVTVTVTNSTTVAMNISTVGFGALAAQAANDTSDDVPAPFGIRNDGNINVNITVEATNLWTTQACPIANYSAKCGNTTEWNCTGNGSPDGLTAGGSLIGWNPINATGQASTFIANLSFVDTKDVAELEVKIQVPPTEGGGAKTSTVTFASAECNCGPSDQT